MAQWDLLPSMVPYLDPHLLVPVFEFLYTRKIYQKKVVQKCHMEMARVTKLVCVYEDFHTKFFPNEILPEEHWEKKSRLINMINGYSNKIQPLFNIFGDDTAMEQIRKMRDGKDVMKYLMEKDTEKKVTPDMVEDLYPLAKVVHDCGEYKDANHYLYYYRLLSPNWEEHCMDIMWGKLATAILSGDWDNALHDLVNLKEYVEGMSFTSALQALQLRTWLIHWSLYVYRKISKGPDYLIEHFLYSQNYLNTIQTTCPYILRYIAAAVISHVNSKTKSVLRDLVRIIQQEAYSYRDPITEFIECLCINYDFDGAQQKLRECQVIVNSDYFLEPYSQVFMENARLLIFETFCRVHECISINMLSEKLNMNQEEAEHWIVNLIRNARLDAKIDSKLGHVMMGNMAVSPYQQLIDKTKSLAYRVQVMASSLETKSSERVNLFHHDLA